MDALSLACVISTGVAALAAAGLFIAAGRKGINRKEAHRD